MDAGHEARLLANAAKLGGAEALGVPTTALAGDIRSALASDSGVAGVVVKGGGFNAIVRALARNSEFWLRALIEAGTGAMRSWRRDRPGLSVFPPRNT
jgi:sterol 3beta-glucosyltransferase